MSSELYYNCKVNYTKKRNLEEAMDTKIQELRKANKISQAELADALDVTRQTIISLEKGRYNASLELAYKIAKYFGKTIEEVFIFEP